MKGLLDFFRSHELLWILPLSLIFGFLSVAGLNAGKSIESYEEINKGMIPLSSINSSVSRTDQIYCKSRVIYDFALLYDDPSMYKISYMVVYDAVYRNYTTVDNKTECGLASNEFKQKALKEGYKWQDWYNE